ncbi:MAG: class I SAM-dependent methyltransferase [Acidimicrobiales bacterium]|nr:class I SAM-dependent methyltransferase [Acidimicrobiales bacterium]
MKGPRSPAARRTLSLYDDAPRGDRLHTRLRWWSAPFADLELEVPLAGSILEVGCGHGLFSCYLAVAGRARTVLGIDVDAGKIAVADAAAAHLAPDEADVRFAVVGDSLPRIEGGWRSIVIADVLYLLGAEGRRRLLDDCVDVLAPGGLLVVKEIDRYPVWKARLATVQELAATRVLRITEGDHVAFADPRAIADQLARRGCTTMVKRLDHGYPHPHCVVLATAPT